MVVLDRLLGRGPLAAHEAVSCDPERLYAEGGFYDVELGLDRLVELSRAARGSFETLGEVFPRAPISRPAPASVDGPDKGWTDEIAGSWTSHDATLRVVAPSLLVRIKDALVWQGLIIVRRRGRYVPLYELFRQIDRPLKADRLEERLAAARRLDVPRPRDAAYLYLGSAGSLNYGHWLVDDLPSLAAVPLLRERFRQVETVMTALGPPMDETRREGIGLAVPDGAIGSRLLHENYACRFDELHYVTPMTYHPMLKNPHAVAFLRGLGERVEAGPGWEPPGERLFVNRSGAYRRRLGNAGEVAAALSGLGFVEVFPESMPVREQWLAFRSARQVVGLMGAAMTNTLFMPPGSPLLHLAFEGWPDPFFWDLAAMAGQPNSVLFGSPPEGEEETFSVDPDRLLALLGRAGRLAAAKT